MKSQALGLIETQSLVASIAALDEMAKAADVCLLGKDHPGNARSTITITGDVAAVKAAVEAGLCVAGKVGNIKSSHVIPRPGPDIDILITKVKKNEDPAGSKTASPDKKTPASKSPGRKSRAPLEKMTVSQLRQLARKTPGLDIKGREISKADKSTLLKVLAKTKSSK